MVKSLKYCAEQHNNRVHPVVLKDWCLLEKSLIVQVAFEMMCTNKNLGQMASKNSQKSGCTSHSAAFTPSVYECFLHSDKSHTLLYNSK